jgi:transcriptional regulator NrdR family protein
MAGATCPYCDFINKSGYDVARTKKGKAGGWDHHHTVTCSDCEKRFTVVERK